MRGLRPALLGLGLLALLAGLGGAALILTSDHVDNRGLATALIVCAGWGFTGTGLYAWDRRPGNPIGPLMTAVGFTWFFQALASSNNEIVFAIGAVGNSVPYGILIHLLVSFPSGRLYTRAERTVVGLGYLVTIGLAPFWAVFTNPAQDGCEGCPENPILIEGHQGIANAVNAFQVAIGIGVIVATVLLVRRHWQRSDAIQRRALTPVVLTGAVAFSLVGIQLVVDITDLTETAEEIAYVTALGIFILLPFAFLLGLLRSRIGRAEEVTTALSAENEHLNTELEATIAELRASRHRIVEAGYAERQRVERDLHDGAQQRLLALTMTLRLARDRVGEDPAAAAELLDEAMAELGEATAELRELARGIHPVLLSERGLGAALDGLADRSPVPVEVLATPDERLPPAVEMATYFVVAEALTNVARYAEAELATVRVARRNGALEVEVRDDGRGGADPEAGTGLRGLADRVAALEGRLAVRSEAGAGTTVEARIPCE